MHQTLSTPFTFHYKKAHCQLREDHSPLQVPFTCDVKPQGGRALLHGHHAHNFSHLVILHDSEIVDWLIKQKWESGGSRSPDPLNV